MGIQCEPPGMGGGVTTTLRTSPSGRSALRWSRLWASDAYIPSFATWVGGLITI